MVDFVWGWSEKTEISVGRFISWLGVTESRFYNGRQRYGRVTEHTGWVPRDFWLEPWEKEAIISFHLKNPLEGYRRLTFMSKRQTKLMFGCDARKGPEWTALTSGMGHFQCPDESR